MKKNVTKGRLQAAKIKARLALAAFILVAFVMLTLTSAGVFGYVLSNTNAQIHVAQSVGASFWSGLTQVGED